MWEKPPAHVTPSFSVAYWIYCDGETLQAAHLGWVLEYDADTTLAAAVQFLSREG